MTMHKKHLPLGFSGLRDMLTQGCVYVDKTELLHRLITMGTKYCLLTRPRRFGKSLIISTLEELFLGNKELFTPLWLGKKNDFIWNTHPILRLDLSMMDCSSAQALEHNLIEKLEAVARSYNIDLSSRTTITGKLEHLIKSLALKQSVVILIDEYDYPLIAHRSNTELTENNTTVLRTFYTALKGLNAEIRFLFISGVSKFPQESIFSGLNNVKDISLLPEYAALAGYTEEEIQANFTPHIEEIAQQQNTNTEHVRDEMRKWYNGYHFSSAEISVYNPFSVLNYLSDKKFSNYWFFSGTPTFLIDSLKSKKYTVKDLEWALTMGSTLTVFDPKKISLATLLYQTGYLTIRPQKHGGATYQLQYPNYEVQMSMHQSLLSVFAHTQQDEIIGIAEFLKTALKQNDVASFVKGLQILLANIPYDLHIEQESYYHSIFHTTGFLLGLDTHSEVHTSIGRIDIVIDDKDTIFIIELKCNKTPQEALQQIKERRYYEKYRAPGKNIFLIGLAFTFPNKKLTVNWVSEQL